MFAEAAAKAPSGTYVGISTIDKVQRLVSYRKLNDAPVYVMFAVGTKAVLARWWEQMALFAAFALAAMLGLGSMTYLALSRTRGAQQAVQNLLEETQRHKQTEAKLVTAQRMEALGQLTGGIAHDFNNLLTVVMGNLDLLRRAKEDRRPRLIDNGMHAVEQGRRLTQQLLAFGRRQNLRPEILDVNMLIAGMTDMIIQSLRGDIKFELDLADKIWPVEVDPVQLQTALINLAVNARDAMPRGGSFVVRTVNSALGEGPGVAISVSDTGSGMQPEVLERAFEPFFTTKEIGRGTGLGLSQVTGFIHQSGGAVDISSEVGRGTTVSLLLPRASGEVVAEASPVSTEVASERRPARILLVEDNPQVRELAALILAEEGHDVVEASQADQALQIIISDASIELVFSDLVMPGTMDGLDLARAVRERRPGVLIVLATGYSEAAAKVLADGFVLVPKPYRPDILALTVRKALSERPSVSGSGNVIALVAPALASDGRGS
jgi:two-component system NtrC family sensor kinase